MTSFDREKVSGATRSNAVKAFFFKKPTRQCSVSGHSMEPFLLFGQTVIITQFNWPLKKGRCYAFINGNTLTIHRFIKKFGKNHALFAGDNNILLDRVDLCDVVGELLPCQNRWGQIIIMIVNWLLCAPMMTINKNLTILSIRRRIIRSFTGLEKRRVFGHEKEI